MSTVCYLPAFARTEKEMSRLCIRWESCPVSCLRLQTHVNTMSHLYATDDRYYENSSSKRIWRKIHRGPTGVRLF